MSFTAGLLTRLLTSQRRHEQRTTDSFRIIKGTLVMRICDVITGSPIHQVKAKIFMGVFH